MPRLEMPRVPKRMPRSLGQEEILRVMAELAPHVADALQLSLHFGLRKKEALTLEVGNVDFGMNGIWLRGERTNNGADEFIPGNGPAMALLRRLVDAAREAKQVRLVLFRGTRGDEHPRPISDITQGWSAARQRAGLSKTARFHDARAAYVTALAQSAPAPVVQALARHRDFETTLRYIRLTDEAKRDAVSNLPNWADPAASRTHGSHTLSGDPDPLPANSLKRWRARRDSNSRPSAPEADALSN